MKYIFLSLAVSFLILSCESEGELTKTEVGSAPILPESVLQYSGVFKPTSGIAVTGKAGIYLDGTQYKVSLEGFSISSGPDLKVYLSTSEKPNEFINLGALGNGMSQTYLIPKGVDFNTYKYVLINCQQYNHLFAIASLNVK
ncbi:hypothetical protein GJU43_21855 [Flavobacterium sp. LC2016-23]|uniref:DM13 domain-containing protein n=1 Tax=Flavobacterium sp. LC2016-23 TaxID=2666330 RepID=UPI0012B1128D|nr:DM13 domain-containing protein [Flavobacterium sp. LC2016-23]MRX41932.1 hypothetical protein [Flavobacterium sp. LC2016-23]